MRPATDINGNQVPTEADHARDELRRLLPPGATVYTVNESVARSNQSAIIKVYCLDGDSIRFLSGLIERADIGFKRARTQGTYGYKYSDGLKVSGCGLDRGFQIVYDLGRALYHDGFECIGKGCPANDHVNGVIGTTHRAGGYALKHRWL